MASKTKMLPTDSAPAGWTDVLAQVPLFSGLSKRHVRSLAKLAKVQRFPAYTDLVRQGERGNSFHLILDGQAVVHPAGKRPVKLSSGAYFGELALLTDAPRSATVTAQSEVVVARIGRDDFLRMLEHEPKVTLALLRTMAAQMRPSQPGRG